MISWCSHDVPEGPLIGGGSASVSVGPTSARSGLRSHPRLTPLWWSSFPPVRRPQNGSVVGGGEWKGAG